MSENQHFLRLQSIFACPLSETPARKSFDVGSIDGDDDDGGDDDDDDGDDSDTSLEGCNNGGNLEIRQMRKLPVILNDTMKSKLLWPPDKLEETELYSYTFQLFP